MFSVWDCAACGGRGACLGSGRLAVPVPTLVHREEHAAEVGWEEPRAGRLQLSYMLQKQWRPELVVGGGIDGISGAMEAAAQDWSSGASTAGAYAGLVRH